MGLAARQLAVSCLEGETWPMPRPCTEARVTGDGDLLANGQESLPSACLGPGETPSRAPAPTPRSPRVDLVPPPLGDIGRAGTPAAAPRHAASAVCAEARRLPAPSARRGRSCASLGLPAPGQAPSGRELRSSMRADCEPSLALYGNLAPSSAVIKLPLLDDVRTNAAPLGLFKPRELDGALVPPAASTLTEPPRGASSDVAEAPPMANTSEALLEAPIAEAAAAATAAAIWLVLEKLA